MYSSSMGGHTENRQYVYGNYGISYLKAVDDSRWDAASDNKYSAWSKGFTKKDLAKRFGFDSVTSWSVAKRGSSARLNGVRITGQKAGKTVTASFTGAQAKTRLGLRSPGFVFGAVPATGPAVAKKAPVTKSVTR
jgi:peptidoglycan hydrolase-like amidase